MRVRAADNHRVPLEHAPREHITSAKAVDVPETLYYRRRLTAGELLRETIKPTAPAAGGESDTSRKKGSHA